MKRLRLRAERRRRLLKDLERRAGWRDGAPDHLTLELQLALEHPLELLGLPLERRQELAGRTGGPRDERGGGPSHFADCVLPRLQQVGWIRHGQLPLRSVWAPEA